MAVAESIVDHHKPPHWQPYTSSIEERCWSVWRIKAGVKAAIRTITK